MTVTEVILSTSSDDDHVLMWDLRTLAVLGSYKGNAKCSRRGLSLLGPRLLVSTQADKASIRIWAYEKDQPLHRFSGPEKIPVIASTPDGSLCFGGSANGKILVWQVSNGQLVRVFDAHFKAVTVLRVTDDSGILISGGADGAVHVWDVASLTQGQPGEQATPSVTFSEHALAITDIHVGVGGRVARVVSSSLDRSCKIWELSSGMLLCSLVFSTAVTSVIMDPAEFNLLAGTTTGAIFSIPMYFPYESAFVRSSSSQLDKERHIDNSNALQHNDGRPVQCLALSYDATLLVAGMADGTVAVWDVACRQLMKTFHNHKGEITNVLSCTKPPTVLTQQFSAASIPAVAPFARYLPEELHIRRAEARIFSVSGDEELPQEPSRHAGVMKNRSLLEESLMAQQEDDNRQKMLTERDKLESGYRIVLAENERIRGLNSELYRRLVEAELKPLQE